MMLRWAVCLWLTIWWSGCSTTAPRVAATRPFDFSADTFAYANELKWEYHIDPATGAQTSTRRAIPPKYGLHCFVVARSARQFFDHARFDARQPRADEATYRRLIHEVMGRSPRRESAEVDKIVIPGFANLREFSQAEESLLKEGCGHAWQSYVQRGHWRMIFPFSTRQQVKTAESLVESLKRNRPLVVHVVRFPQLSINHAVVLFGVTEGEKEIRFATYDPNAPEKPTVLIFHRDTQRFDFPANAYFHGGRVDVYEVYRNAIY